MRVSEDYEHKKWGLADKLQTENDINHQYQLQISHIITNSTYFSKNSDIHIAESSRIQRNIHQKKQ